MHPLATHPDRTGPSRPRRAAFTLIEILVAIGVVVALIAVAVPTIVLSFGDRNLEAEAERLGATMASLRAEAVRRRETLALFLEPASGAFGGALFIGPLSSDESESVRLPGDRPLGPHQEVRPQLTVAGDGQSGLVKRFPHGRKGVDQR